VKRNGRDEPIRVVIHIFMETTQGNSLCSYLYLKLAKKKVMLLFLSFSSTKSENRWVEQILLGVGMCWAFGISRRVGGGKRV
jgi:hypothetical protein